MMLYRRTGCTKCTIAVTGRRWSTTLLWTVRLCQASRSQVVQEQDTPRTNKYASASSCCMMSHYSIGMSAGSLTVTDCDDEVPPDECQQSGGSLHERVQGSRPWPLDEGSSVSRSADELPVVRETHVVLMFIGRHESQYLALDHLHDEAASGTLFIPFIRSSAELCLRRLARYMRPLDLTVAAQCALDESQNTLRAVLLVQTDSIYNTLTSSRALSIGFDCQSGFILAIHIGEKDHRLRGVVITAINLSMPVEE